MSISWCRRTATSWADPKCPRRGGCRPVYHTHTHALHMQHMCCAHPDGGWRSTAHILHMQCICNTPTARPPSGRARAHQTQTAGSRARKSEKRVAGPSCTRGCWISRHAGAPPAAADAAAPSDGARSGRKVGGWAARSPSARAQHAGTAHSREIRARPCHPPGLLPN